MGVILGAHGVKGEVKVKSFAASDSGLLQQGLLHDVSGRTYRLIAAHKVGGRAEGDLLIARIDGVNDREAATALKGTELYLDRAQLPEIAEENTYYAHDLLHLRVLDRDGVFLGRVSNVVDYGAGTILDVAGGEKGEFSLPFTNAFVPEIDLERGVAIVDLPADFFAEMAPEVQDSEGDEG